MVLEELKKLKKELFVQRQVLRLSDEHIKILGEKFLEVVKGQQNPSEQKTEELPLSVDTQKFKSHAEEKIKQLEEKLKQLSEDEGKRKEVLQAMVHEISEKSTHLKNKNLVWEKLGRLDKTEIDGVLTAFILSKEQEDTAKQTLKEHIITLLHEQEEIKIPEGANGATLQNVTFKYTQRDIDEFDQITSDTLDKVADRIGADHPQLAKNYDRLLKKMEHLVNESRVNIADFIFLDDTKEDKIAHLTTKMLEELVKNEEIALEAGNYVFVDSALDKELREKVSHESLLKELAEELGVDASRLFLKIERIKSEYYALEFSEEKDYFENQGISDTGDINYEIFFEPNIYKDDEYKEGWKKYLMDIGEIKESSEEKHELTESKEDLYFFFKEYTIQYLSEQGIYISMGDYSFGELFEAAHPILEENFSMYLKPFTENNSFERSGIDKEKINRLNEVTEDLDKPEKLEKLREIIKKEKRQKREQERTKEIERLGERITKLQTKGKELEKEGKKARKTIRIDPEVERLESIKKRLEKKVENLENQIATLTAEVPRIQGEKAALKEEQQRLKGELENAPHRQLLNDLIAKNIIALYELEGKTRITLRTKKKTFKSKKKTYEEDGTVKADTGSSMMSKFSLFGGSKEGRGRGSFLSFTSKKSSRKGSNGLSEVDLEGSVGHDTVNSAKSKRSIFSFSLFNRNSKIGKGTSGGVKTNSAPAVGQGVVDLLAKPLGVEGSGGNTSKRKKKKSNRSKRSNTFS